MTIRRLPRWVAIEGTLASRDGRGVVVQLNEAIKPHLAELHK
jgi:hypothetical protein